MAKMQVWRPFVKSYLTNHCRFNPSNLAHLFAIHSVRTLLFRKIYEWTFRCSQRVNRIAHLPPRGRNKSIFDAVHEQQLSAFSNANDKLIYSVRPGNVAANNEILTAL